MEARVGIEPGFAASPQQNETHLDRIRSVSLNSNAMANER
jgi:hypothetical protein